MHGEVRVKTETEAGVMCHKPEAIRSYQQLQEAREQLSPLERGPGKPWFWASGTRTVRK